MTRKKGRREGGFTLIELIIVIVIIGILAAVAIPRFLSLTADAERGVARGVTAALRGSIQVQHSQMLLAPTGAPDTYDATEVVAGVDAANVILGNVAAVITATFPSGNTFTWAYVTNIGVTTMAAVTESF